MRIALLAAAAALTAPVLLAPAAHAAPAPLPQVKASLLTAKQASKLIKGIKVQTGPGNCMDGEWAPNNTDDPNAVYTQCYAYYQNGTAPNGYTIASVGVRSFMSPEYALMNQALYEQSTTATSGKEKVVSQSADSIVTFTTRKPYNRGYAQVVSGVTMAWGECWGAKPATQKDLTTCATKVAQAQLAKASSTLG